MADPAKHTGPPRLQGDQLAASDPRELVRLSASAGTGKTQVLTARVLRLLLSGADPESILCLTFTKAGAAEMQERIHSQLGRWVTMKDAALDAELKAIGEHLGPNQRDEARKLFAQVLDARGSGLRIQTIHSFSQSLLASFPDEAGLPPGFRAIEGREEDQIASAALGALVDGYEREGRGGALERLKTVVMRLGEDGTRTYLRRAAHSLEALETLPGDSGLDAWVRVNLAGMDDIAGALERACGDEVFDLLTLRAMLEAYRGWVKKNGDPYAEGVKAVTRITAWLGASPSERMVSLKDLRSAWTIGDGSLRTAKPPVPDMVELIERADALVLSLLDLANAIKLAPAVAAALHIARDYARVYDLTKRQEGVVDFQDLIQRTVALLGNPGIGDWIRFKLDQSIDHLLIDEAQDTNADQWTIAKSLTSDFFSGDTAHAGRNRTIFMVGDFKQAIFRFQGTDPREFEDATRYFADQAARVERTLETRALDKSWRSSQPILDLTNAVLKELQHEAMGLPEPAMPHLSGKGGSGSVTLLPPVTGVINNADDEEGEDEDGDQIGQAELIWATQLAGKVKDWTTGGLFLSNQNRAAEPGDVMILLRNRGQMARLIVSQLHQQGVPVSGVDRLTLGAPIAVQDLLACIRFVLQPDDELSLASLLVSPLVGWDQNELYARAKNRNGRYLWKHLGDHKPSVLSRMLDRADLTTPYAFLEFILSDPEIAGRRKFLARLGEEARDPIEALLSEALAFEKQATPTLQRFLDWFDRGEVEIKRDAAKPENAVRVMTAHGAKGLQAPVVVLGDATFNPDGKQERQLDWQPDDEKPSIPLFRPRKGERSGSIAASADLSDQLNREEHWRLLYVAITRAEEHLFIGGSVKPKRANSAKGLGEDCWHTRLSIAMQALEATQAEDGSLLYVHTEALKDAKDSPFAALERMEGTLPAWAIASAPQEARPPRPLAPSRIEPADAEASPPPNPAQRKAAERGIILHGLFERLPHVALGLRRELGGRWLERSAGIADEEERSQLLDEVISILEEPSFADLFAPGSLAEIPLAAVVGGSVIAGTVDRLLVQDDHVLVIDYKTGRRVPHGASQVTPHHAAQMAAYVAALQIIYPGKAVRAALLYTQGPKLITLPEAILERYKPGFTPAQP